MGWKQNQHRLTDAHKAVLAQMFMSIGSMMGRPEQLQEFLGQEALAWLPENKAEANAKLDKLAECAFAITSRFMTDDYDQHRPVTKESKVSREHGRSFINQKTLMEYADQDVVFKAEFEDHYDAALATLKLLLSKQLDASLRAAQKTSRDVS